MKVNVLFKARCHRDQSLHYRDSGNADDAVIETFMIRVLCSDRAYVSSLRERLTDMYTFIAVNSIADLDEELAEEFDTVYTLWKNYQDYHHDNGNTEGEAADTDNKVVSIVALSDYNGASHSELCKFHDLLRDNPITQELMEKIKENVIPGLGEYNLNSYHINSPHGCYEFNGHSYDAVEGNEVFVDQLLTSSERYELVDEESGGYNGKIELSTQQCIVVDEHDPQSNYKPYMMVNKSGLRQLERFGDIETLRVRVGKELEQRATTTANTGVANQQGNETTNWIELKHAIVDLCTIFTDSISYTKPPTAKECELLTEIGSELLPLLNSILEDVAQTVPAAPVEREVGFLAIVSMTYQYVRRLTLGLFRNWIFNGLGFNVAYSLFKTAIVIFMVTMVTTRFNIPTYLVVIILTGFILLSENMIEIVGKIGIEAGIPVFTQAHNFLRTTKALTNTSIESVFQLICRFCISYKRPVYLDSQEIIDEEMQGNAVSKILICCLRVLQDAIVLVLTIVPTFADVYQRTFRELQQQQRDAVPAVVDEHI